MADILKVTPDDLRRMSGEFSSTNGTMRTLTTSMLETVRKMSGEIWQGEASRTYIDKFNGLEDDMQKIHDTIQKYVEKLEQIATNYDTTENTNVEASAPLKVDLA